MKGPVGYEINGQPVEEKRKKGNEHLQKDILFFFFFGNGDPHSHTCMVGARGQGNAISVWMNGQSDLEVDGIASPQFARDSSFFPSASILNPSLLQSVIVGLVLPSLFRSIGIHQKEEGENEREIGRDRADLTFHNLRAQKCVDH